jgi:hypothetical protein
MELCQLSCVLSGNLFEQLFPPLFGSLGNEQQQRWFVFHFYRTLELYKFCFRFPSSLVGSLTSMFCQKFLVKSNSYAFNPAHTLLKAVLNTPGICLPSSLLRFLLFYILPGLLHSQMRHTHSSYLAKTHNAWHLVVEELRGRFLQCRSGPPPTLPSFPDDVKLPSLPVFELSEKVLRGHLHQSRLLVKDDPQELLRVISDLYKRLNEFDLWHGLWLCNSVYPETALALSLEQNGPQ